MVSTLKSLLSDSDGSLAATLFSMNGYIRSITRLKDFFNEPIAAFTLRLAGYQNPLCPVELYNQ